MTDRLTDDQVAFHAAATSPPDSMGRSQDSASLAREVQEWRRFGSSPEGVIALDGVLLGTLDRATSELRRLDTLRPVCPTCEGTGLKPRPEGWDQTAHLDDPDRTCSCHDSWDQCPCADDGHFSDCACCPGGTALCGPLPCPDCTDGKMPLDAWVGLLIETLRVCDEYLDRSNLDGPAPQVAAVLAMVPEVDEL